MKSATNPTDAGLVIDAALGRLGSAQPAPGFEARLTARIAAAETSRSPKVFSFPFPARLGAAAVATALAAAAMLLVSTDHTPRRISLPPSVRIAPHGFGAASAARLPSQPVQATTRGRSVARPLKGRAVLSQHQARKTPGTGVPRSPFPASDSPAESSPPQP
jgi:hypothetical protein